MFYYTNSYNFNNVDIIDIDVLELEPGTNTGNYPKRIYRDDYGILVYDYTD
ncbi:MAG: hypothetical protein ACI35S_00675 [Anaeroplasma sp.]